MAEAARDGNRVTVLMGSFNGAPTSLKVDHATGYLKAAIYNQVLAAPTVSATVAAHDDNRVHSATASFNGAIRTLKVTHVGNYLRAVNN